MKKHLIIFLFLTPLVLSAQYTETINSNRPGTSHGAFSIGKDVLQFELGISQLNLNHIALAAIPVFEVAHPPWTLSSDRRVNNL